MVWKGLTRLDELCLLAAAQTLRMRLGHGTDQDLRNHVLLAVLFCFGRRVSEMLGLDRDQYNGKGFERIQVKGGMMGDCMPVSREARKVFDGRLGVREDEAPPIFIMRTGRRLSRREAATIIQRMSAATDELE